MIRRLSKIDLEESFVPPDYEEVDPVQVQQLRRALSVNKMRKNDKNNADNNTQRIMKSTIYCIHKVNLLSFKFPALLFCFVISLSLA